MTASPVRVNIYRILPSLVVLLGIAMAQASFAAITLTQANGESLVLPGPAQRIITLAPNLAELVFTAGAGDRLKGVVEYSNFPAQVSQLPRVGDAFRIDLERVVELNPDLVIAWSSGNPQTALQKLTQLGIAVWQLEITHPNEIANTVDNIARAAGTQIIGDARALQLRNKLADLQQKYAGKFPVDYFYQVASRPLYTINGQHIISRSLEICGARNVFSDLPALAPQVSLESVIVANPLVMIAPQTPGDPPALLAWQEWPQLQAVKNDSMLYLPADEISQATPRLLESIDLACRLLDEARSLTRQLEE
jgi:iron complex transport system substrate-binding protein